MLCILPGNSQLLLHVHMRSWKITVYSICFTSKIDGELSDQEIKAIIWIEFKDI